MLKLRIIRFIKKTGKVMAYIVGVLLLLLVISYFLFRTSVVQTWISQRIATSLSKELNTRIEIGGVDIEFIKKVVLEDIYIEDQHKDTLLFSPRLKVDISEFNFNKRKLIIKQVILEDTKAHLVRYKNEPDYNYQFIIDAFSSNDTTRKSSAPWDVQFKALNLSNINFIYRDEHNTGNEQGLNYFDIHTTQTYAIISDIRFNKDTIQAHIEHLSANEKSGFILNDFSCFATVCPTFTGMDKLKIETPRSNVITDMSFKYDRYRSYYDFINQVYLQASFSKTKIGMEDIAFFAPELLGIEHQLFFSGEVNGKINDLKGKGLKIDFGPTSYFKGDVDLKGLPDIDETFIRLDVEQLISNKKELEQIPLPPFTEKKRLKIPDNLSLLGRMKFTGSYTGYFNNFVAFGTLNTALGTVVSDLSMRKGTGKDSVILYEGKIKSYDFDIGKFLALENLGKITIDASVDGKGLKQDNVNASLRGIVKNIEYNNYNYHNVSVEGDMAKNIFNGKLDVKDENIKMLFSGNIDFREALPIMDFNSSIENANLTALNFIESEKSAILSTTLKVNAIGSNIDNLEGKISVSNTKYVVDTNTYKSSSLEMTISETSGYKTIQLFSDFADITLEGRYAILDLPYSFQSFVNTYFPVLSENELKVANLPKQNFSFSILFKNTNDITRLFLPGVGIMSGSHINGRFDTGNNDIALNAISQEINLYGIKIKNWTLNLYNQQDSLALKTKAGYIYLSDSLRVYQPSLAAFVGRSSSEVNSKINWFTDNELNRASNLNIAGTFGEYRKVDLRILPSSLYISDSLWVADTSNSILFDTASVRINNVVFKANGQMLRLDGLLSKLPEDKVQLQLQNFNLTAFNPFLHSSGIKLEGIVSGETSVTDFYHRFILASVLDFKKLKVNDELLGNGTVRSTWEKEKEMIDIKGTFARGEIPNLKFEGSYYPFKKENSIDLTVELLALRLQMFSDYVKGYCSDFNGQFGGSIQIKGTPEKPLIDGKLNVSAKKITVDYLNTSYGFAGNVIIENNSFGVQDLVINDLKDIDDQKKVGTGSAVVNGKLYHDNFKNFQLDFDMNANKFMCLNTNASLNSSYYGKANLSGIISFFGYINNITIDASVKTEKGTQFFIPLEGISEVGESSFITFVNGGSDTGNIAKKYKVEIGGTRLDFNLDITPDAEVQLIFDPKMGDIIKGRGTGDLNLVINSSGDFSMYGDYYITEGDYLFTLKNIINKRFDIEKGGNIKWTGDPFEATINLTAVYRQRASIRPFFPSSDSSSAYSKRYPVDCKLILTEKLMAPQITFDIELPTVDESTKQIIASYINTEQEMNKQVFSLLILKSFVTPPQLVGQSVAESGAYAGRATSSELLSNQLSNWLSQISKDFDIGVNYRPGDEISSSDEVEVALSTQVLNDRVTIDGSVGVTGNTAATQQQNVNNIAGDVNVEYKITDDGKLRVRVFNKANESTEISTATAPYTQGLGVFYREEFNTLSELYNRYLVKMSGFKKKRAKGNKK